MRPRCGNCPPPQALARELSLRAVLVNPGARPCRGSVDTVACDSVPVSVPQTSLAQALDVRLTRGFVPRLTSMLRSIRGGGPGRPARRAQAGLGEGHEPACHLRPQHVCLHLAHPSMYGATCPPAARSVASHRDNESSPCAGRRASFSRIQHRLHEEVVGFMRYESYGKAIGPPARRCRFVGKTLRICVPVRLPMAKCSRDAFPSVRRWRDCALMRSWPDWQWRYTRAMRSPSAYSWQDSATVRSRALADGKMLAKCVPGRQSVASFALHASRKWPRTGKSPVRGSISPPCIQNELALAGYARHASEKPRKQPFGNTPREDLAMKGPLSLHRPLESCTARESCHPLTLDLSATRRLR